MRLDLPELRSAELAQVSGEDASEKLDALEEELFGIKDYFLRQPVLIPLYQTRIRRVLWIEAAIRLIGGKIVDGGFDQPEDLSGMQGEMELIGLVRSLAGLQNQQRLKVAGAANGLVIAHAAWEMCRIEEAYMRRFMQLTSDQPVWTEPVKAAERPDSGDLIWLLKQEDQALVLHELISKERRRCQDLLARMDAT